MDGYSGFEPEVGEIRALRTFRIGIGGLLYPLFGKQSWTNGTNTARCTARPPASPPPPPRPHHAPEPDCSCGFYAYGSASGISEPAHATNVLAVVACWGRVIAGTRGIRAEHSRIEAIWMSARVPPDLAAMVIARYPSAAPYTDRATMLADHPPTHLNCYEIQEPRESALSPAVVRVATVLALIVGSLPTAWVATNHPAYLVGAADLCLVLIGAATFRRQRTRADARRQALLALAVVLWMVAPVAGLAGIVLLRLPLLQIAAAIYLQRRLLERAATRFPAEIG
jgi:hypothetical protein